MRSEAVGSFAAGSSFAEWQAKGRDKGSIYADPQLNITDWRLAPSSPARQLGFIPIDVSRVGPRRPLVGAPTTLVAPSDVRESIGPELFAAQRIYQLIDV